MNRRDFHKNSGALILTYLVGGATLSLSPAAAQDKGIPYQILSPEEAELVNLLGEALVPGARKAGLGHYLDHQLAAAEGDSLLMIKYLGVHPPHAPFYQQALKALKNTLPNHSPDALTSYIRQMAKVNPPGWENAPPAPFFYFVLRADALDVTYGTQDGFDHLDIPYMAHIAPQGRTWS